MKFFHSWLVASSALLLCACTVTPAPTAPSALARAEALTATDGAEEAFLRAFLQNGFESPDRLEPIRVLRGPLRLYIRTHDDTGRAIDRVTLTATERTLIESAGIWSGGTFGFIDIERGTTTREKQPGWLTVKWSNVVANGRCGRSTVGVDGGFIEFNVSGECNCGMATAVYPRLVRHELGHAMGYYHTDQATDVMYGQPIVASACDLLPSDRERRHARIAHQSNIE